MEPVSIAVVCIVVFGTVIALSAFIRQLLLSRNNNLNNKAQLRALTIESQELQRIYSEMEQQKSFDTHYQLLGANKESVAYLDNAIAELLKKKGNLIERYSKITIQESKVIIEEGAILSRKEVTDKLKIELDSELAFYDGEMEQFQKRREVLWDSHHELKDFLVDQEKSRSTHLDKMYLHHASLLEKMYLRHNEKATIYSLHTTDIASPWFKSLGASFNAFLTLFGKATSVEPEKAAEEEENRKKVSETESSINNNLEMIEGILSEKVVNQSLKKNSALQC